MYNRKHFPGRVRPARPARCCAEAWDIGDTSRDSTLTRGLYTYSSSDSSSNIVIDMCM